MEGGDGVHLRDVGRREVEAEVGRDHGGDGTGQIGIVDGDAAGPIEVIDARGANGGENPRAIFRLGHADGRRGIDAGDLDA